MKTDVKTPSLLPSILGQSHDFCKTNADLHGSLCFITSFQISCNIKKNFTTNVIG